MADALLNRTLRHYRIERVIGQGGMGVVYRATDLQLRRSVAIKVMHAQYASQRDFQDRFFQEARTSAALDHPSIVRVFDSDLDSGTLYLVMEFVSGGSLREYLKQLYEQRKFIAVPEALMLTRQIAEALDYAHVQGVLHRDVKPDNVLLKAISAGSDDAGFRGILTDFGLVKLTEGGVQSLSGAPTGTLPYMSPEQAQAEALDGRTDLYALGVMLYELSTGRLPFMPRNIPEAIKMHTNVMPDPPTKVRASLSPALEQVILKSLAKRPEDRYQTGGEFAKALRAIEASGGQVKRAAEGVRKPTDPPELPPEKVESIGTYLQSMAEGNKSSPRIKLPVAPNEAAGGIPGSAAPAPQADPPALPPNDTANDRLVILTEGEAPRFFPLIKSPIEIGREPGLDLQLASAKVSRHHARLERRKDGQYTVMDLGSSNGTYLGETKLLSNIPEIWVRDEPVRMGNFWLYFQRAAQRFDTGRPVQNVPSMVAPDAPVVPTPGRPVFMNAPQDAAALSGIAVILKPPALTVEPGGRVDMQVEILNQSELVEHYQFEIVNLPREWCTVPMTTLQLMPGSKGNVSLNFHPPRNCKSTAGLHDFSVRVVSQERRKELSNTPATLTINPFSLFETDLQPRRIRNKGEVRVLVTNKGNAPEAFTLAPRDREQALHFDPQNRSVMVNPCETGPAAFFVRPTRRPLIGFGKRLYSYDVGAVSPAGTVQSLPAELLSTPSIPWWLLILLLLLLLLLCAVPAAYVTCTFTKSPALAPQCAVATANLNVTNEHATLDVWLTATANSFAGRQTATYQVTNATATQAANNSALTATATAGMTLTQGAQAALTAQINSQATFAANIVNGQASQAAAAGLTATAQAPKH